MEFIANWMLPESLCGIFPLFEYLTGWTWQNVSLKLPQNSHSPSPPWPQQNRTFFFFLLKRPLGCAIHHKFMIYYKIHVCIMISWSIRRHKNKLVYKIFKLLLKYILRFYSLKCRSPDAPQIITLPAQAAVSYESYILMLMVPVVVWYPHQIPGSPS